MHKVTISNIIAAMNNEEFELHYQAKISMVTGELVGAEALIRWPQENGSFIPPDSFIPIAESSNLICEITNYVFRRLLVDASFINSVNAPLKISFNTSGKDFHDNKLTIIIVDAIKAHKIDAQNLEIEVTETVLVDEDQAKKCLGKLSALGISIAMDDFGTGHSGLVELSKWPFDIIKIDQKFVASVHNSEKDREILQASIRMAHQLEMDVVAEGIEDEETYRVLQEYGCKTAQGYWINKPMPLSEFINYLRSFKNLPAMPIGLLYMAQLDHIQWKKNLIDTALFLHSSKTKRPYSNLRGNPELDPCQCKLGRWYYGAGIVFDNLPGYSELEAPHNALHNTGRELLHLAESSANMEEISQLINQVSQESIQVLSALQSLENSLHLKHYSESDSVNSIIE